MARHLEEIVVPPKDDGDNEESGGESDDESLFGDLSAEEMSIQSHQATSQLCTHCQNIFDNWVEILNPTTSSPTMATRML